MASDTSALLFSLVAMALYGYSAYYMTNLIDRNKMSKILPAHPNDNLGQLKYLTFLTLLTQFFSCILHILAHFIKPLEGLRDLVFSSLAFPLASLVCYVFWGVWHILGRELIFPVALDPIFPNWLNHSVHTVIVPVNIVLSFLVHHRFYKRGFLVTLIFTLLYTILLQYFKARTGRSVYPYLDTMDETFRLVYFAVTGVFTYILYKSGEWLTYSVHGKKPSEGVRSSAQKRKQR